MASAGANSAGGAESGSTASRAARACSTGPLAPHCDGGARRVLGARPGPCLPQGGREKRWVGVRPGVLQTDGAGAETPGTGSRASWGPEERLGAPGFGGRPEGVHIWRSLGGSFGSH